MRWILVWWIIHPGHSQVIHREVYATEEACVKSEFILPANSRHHCSME
jgi:hypothetical protein